MVDDSNNTNNGESNDTEGKSRIEMADKPVTGCSHRAHLKMLIDEPPIGTGGGSFFFDLPEQVVEINPVKDPRTGISSYQLPERYYGVAVLSVLTEESADGGDVTFKTYKVPETEKHAKLILTLETYSGNKEIIIPADDNGSIATNDRFRAVDEKIKKQHRSHRLRHPDPDARVIEWKVVDSSDRVITVDGISYSGSRDDLYYFYISMYHPPHTDE